MVSSAQAEHTGTFFCEMTTAQSLPLMPMDMMFAAVMALNAYSDHVSCIATALGHHTDLV
jgi:hypothetical protein